MDSAAVWHILNCAGTPAHETDLATNSITVVDRSPAAQPLIFLFQFADAGLGSVCLVPVVVERCDVPSCRRVAPTELPPLPANEQVERGAVLL